MHVYYTFKYDVEWHDESVKSYGISWCLERVTLFFYWSFNVCDCSFCHLGGGGGFGSGYGGSYGGGAMKSAGYSQRGAGPYGGLLW